MDGCSSTRNNMETPAFRFRVDSLRGRGGGGLPEKLGGGVRPASQNPYPIYD